MSFAGKWMQLRTIIWVKKANCREKIARSLPLVSPDFWVLYGHTKCVLKVEVRMSMETRKPIGGGGTRKKMSRRA